MPYDRIRDETDGDPDTRYEDTRTHDRPGFAVSEDNVEEFRPQPGRSGRDARPKPDPELK